MTPDKQAYLEKLQLLRRWRNAIVEGIADGSEPEYQELLTWLKANFKADYIDLF